MDEANVSASGAHLKPPSGASPSRPTLPDRPRGCDAEGLSALGTLTDGQWGVGGARPLAANPSQSSLGLDEPAWAFSRDGGGRGPTPGHLPLPKSFCRELDSAGGHLSRLRRKEASSPQGQCSFPSLPAPTSTPRAPGTDVLISVTEWAKAQREEAGSQRKAKEGKRSVAFLFERRM